MTLTKEVRLLGLSMLRIQTCPITLKKASASLLDSSHPWMQVVEKT